MFDRINYKSTMRGGLNFLIVLSVGLNARCLPINRNLIAPKCMSNKTIFFGIAVKMMKILDEKIYLMYKKCSVFFTILTSDNIIWADYSEHIFCILNDNTLHSC